MAFDSKPDMWWSHAGFHCDEVPASHVTFVDILLKVHIFWRMPSWRRRCRLYSAVCSVDVFSVTMGRGHWLNASVMVGDGMGAYVRGCTALQVMPAAMLWGAGTALGEVPPYAVAYHASVASGKVSGMEEALAVRLTARLSRQRPHEIRLLLRGRLAAAVSGLRM